jgi:hypothetical protein
VYTAVVVWRAILRQESGTLKPKCKGSCTPEPAASSEAHFMRISLRDMFGPLSWSPAGTTSDTAMGTTKVVLPVERQNKDPIYVSGVTDARGFLAWLRELCRCGLSAQIKEERLMIIPGTGDCCRSTVTATRLLDLRKGVNFHTFSLPEDRLVRLLIKNLGRQMPKGVVREEVEALAICVQGMMQLHSDCHAVDPSKNQHLTAHFIVSVARGPKVQKVRTLSQLCGLRVSVKRT